VAALYPWRRPSPTTAPSLLRDAVRSLENGNAQFAGNFADFGIECDKAELRAEGAGAAVEQDDVEAASEGSALLGPDKDDSAGLRPAELIACGDMIVVRVEVDDVGLHGQERLFGNGLYLR
jgi:hypothetical protein